MTESSGAVLDEVGDLSFPSSQIMEMVPQISDAADQDSESGVPMACGAYINSRTQRDEVFLAMANLHKG